MTQNSSKTHKVQFSRHNPLFCTIKKRHLLNKEGSTKKVYHLEIDLSNTPIKYETGACLGILPQNSNQDIQRILSFFNTKENEELLKTLIHQCNIIKVTKKLLQLTSEYSKHPFLHKVLHEYSPKERKLFMESIDIPTLLDTYKPHMIPLSDFLSTLQPMLPKFYSIASSYKINPHSIDLMIGVFTYSIGSITREGLCSSFLCEHAALSSTQIGIYLQPNPHFSLPKDPATPVIMIGPGTGLAPFRAFIQERICTQENTPSINWLFTGDRSRQTDFYYQEELEQYVKKGHLNLHTAFSRDQKEKYYVHHKIQEHGKALWDLISNHKAYIYICGDAKHMAKDVTHTLYAIAENYGKLNHEEAMNYFKELRSNARFILDVY